MGSVVAHRVVTLQISLTESCLWCCFCRLQVSFKPSTLMAVELLQHQSWGLCSRNLVVTQMRVCLLPCPVYIAISGRLSTLPACLQHLILCTVMVCLFGLGGAADAMLADVDPDQTGTITFDEFVKLMNKAKGTLRGPHTSGVAQGRANSPLTHCFLVACTHITDTTPGEAANPQVLEFLRILDEYRLKCEAEGNYLEAGRAAQQLETLRKQVQHGCEVLVWFFLQQLTYMLLC